MEVWRRELVAVLQPELPSLNLSQRQRGSALFPSVDGFIRPSLNLHDDGVD